MLSSLFFLRIISTCIPECNWEGHCLGEPCEFFDEAGNGCANDYLCYAANMTCVEKDFVPDQCVNDNDCSSGYVCDFGVVEPLSVPDCTETPEETVEPLSVPDCTETPEETVEPFSVVSCPVVTETVTVTVACY